MQTRRPGPLGLAQVGVPRRHRKSVGLAHDRCDVEARGQIEVADHRADQRRLLGILPAQDQRVGAHARVRNAIVDHNVKIPEHAVIGLDPETNRREGHTVTESGLVIVHADSPGVSVQDVPRRPAASEQGKLRSRARAGDL